MFTMNWSPGAALAPCRARAPASTPRFAPGPEVTTGDR